MEIPRGYDDWLSDNPLDFDTPCPNTGCVDGECQNFASGREAIVTCPTCKGEGMVSS